MNRLCEISLWFAIHPPEMPRLSAAETLASTAVTSASSSSCCMESHSKLMQHVYPDVGYVLIKAVLQLKNALVVLCVNTLVFCNSKNT